MKTPTPFKSAALLYIGLPLAWLLFFSASGKGGNETDCSVFKKGTFQYVGEKKLKNAKIVMKCKTHTEYRENEKYYVKSKLKWIDDCELNLTIKEATIPGFPFSVGDILNLKIDSVVNDIIYTTSTTKNGEAVALFRKVD